jgi:gp37|nr:MAG TPA: holin [Caudoviricetes sp.]
MSVYASPSFWSGLGDRAIKTFSQSLLAAVTVGVGVLDLDWKGALGIAATAVIASVLTSFADPKEADKAVATAVPEYTPRHAS